mgnify:FL=1|tara:strand:- start:1610 stop:2185 length:576 start_codon:yes stop_codon:yes gene_type:complete
MNNYSDYYYQIIEKYKLFHTNGIKNQPGISTFLGYSLTKWIVNIKDIIKITKSNSLIDFGCGKAFLYKNKFKIGDEDFKNLSDFWQIQNIFLYDPGVKEFSLYPDKKYDGLVCTDVIEHIPKTDVINFIDKLFKLSNKFVFFVIATIPASKYFDDGKNIHLCLKTENEWEKIFVEFKDKYPKIEQHIYYNN